VLGRSATKKNSRKVQKQILNTEVVVPSFLSDNMHLYSRKVPIPVAAQSKA